MNITTIDPSWIEIQEGLYLEEYEKVIAGNLRIRRELHSADGWCFYDLQQPENYDEEGNLKPAEERVYATYTSLGIAASSWTYEQINAQFISVPIQPGYEIVSVSNPSVAQ